MSIDPDKLGPPGVRGRLHVLAMTHGESRTELARLQDSTIRTFRVTAQLAKSAVPPEQHQGALAAKDGSSYIRNADPQGALRIETPLGTFGLQNNLVGEISLVEFTCNAESTEAAEHKFFEVVGPFLDHLAFVASAPIVIGSIHISDEANLRQTFRYVSPYRPHVLLPREAGIFQELAPVYSLYRESLNAASDFYRFLCLYKILEGLFGRARTNIHEEARRRSIILPKIKDDIPHSPFLDQGFLKFVGTPVKSFVDSVLAPEYRNAVSHFMTEDGAVLNVTKSTEADRYANIIHITDLCVRQVIATHETLLGVLRHNP